MMYVSCLYEYVTNIFLRYADFHDVDVGGFDAQRICSVAI